MGTFSNETRIDAPKDKVWEVLADLGSISTWHPSVSASRLTSDAPGGESATRHCEVEGMGGKPAYLKERAFDWREGEGFKIDIYETSLPLERNVVTFSLVESGDGTTVRASSDYEIKFGLIGQLMDKLMVRRQFEHDMEDLLAGLEYHVETGNEVIDECPARG